MSSLISTLKQLIESWKLHLIAVALAGFLMCFYGGSFLVLIVAGEAYLLGASLAIQISSSETLTNKLLILLQNPEPIDLSLSLPCVLAGGMAVAAALKFRLGKAIVLGNAVANSILKFSDKVFLPHIVGVLPAASKKWARLILAFIIKAGAVWMALTMLQFSTVHSALRGGLLLSQYSTLYLQATMHYQVNVQQPVFVLEEASDYILSCVGLYFQLVYGFGPPAPLSTALLPVYRAQTMLEGLVGRL